jgi:hypothetical protein
LLDVAGFAVYKRVEAAGGRVMVHARAIDGQRVDGARQ